VTLRDLNLESPVKRAHRDLSSTVAPSAPQAIKSDKLLVRKERKTEHGVGCFQDVGLSLPILAEENRCARPRPEGQRGRGSANLGPAAL